MIAARMSTTWVAVFGCFLLLMAGRAGALVFSAETGVTTISPCPSFCGGPGTAFDSDLDGGPGFASSESSLDNVDGLGRARAELSGPSGLPVLQAEAFSNASAGAQRSSRVSTQAFGLQAYYVSRSIYTLNIALSGIANDVPSPSPTVFNEDASILAHVMILRDNDPSTDLSVTSDYSTMRFEDLPASPDLELLADAVDGSGLSLLSIPSDDVFHTVTATLTISGLGYNDVIYVWSDLAASGTRGGYADAFNTLTMSFEDPTGLSTTPHPPIPEPTTGVLTGLGLITLAARRRR